jgi:hypothetical protein
MTTRHSGRGWLLVLFLFCGVLVGSIIGELLRSVIPGDLFAKSLRVGTVDGPITLNLLVLDLSIGAVLHINFGTVLGLILGILLYKWTVR